MWFDLDDPWWLKECLSNLCSKYEKSKQMAVEVKDSEAKLVEQIEFCQQQMKLQEQRYDKLKNHALSQLEGYVFDSINEW